MDNKESLNNKINNNDLKKRMEDFQDTEGLSTKKLNFGLWYIEHRRIIQQSGIGLLAAFSTFFWLYFLYGITSYIFWGMKADELIINDLVNSGLISHDYFIKNSAKDLVIFGAETVKSQSGKYDYIVKIQNFNDNWWGIINYTYIAGNTVGEGESFILPSEAKYITVFNQEGASDIRFAVKNVSWSRINKHLIPNWDEYKSRRLAFEIKDIQFQPVNKTNLSGSSLNQLSFAVKNNTAYNFQEVDFLVFLTGGAQIIGINKYKLENFLSGEKREVRANWLGNFGRPQVEIYSEVNIMDKAVYKSFE